MISGDANFGNINIGAGAEIEVGGSTAFAMVLF